MTHNQAEEKLKELCHDEAFLAKLLEVGKLYGWSGDYFEISRFIEDLHEYGGKKRPDITPFELTD